MPKLKIMAVGILAAWGLACTGDGEMPLDLDESWKPPLIAALAPNSQSSGQAGPGTVGTGNGAGCMEDVWRVEEGAMPQQTLNCTANDVNLFLTEAGSALSLCEEGTTIPGPVAVNATVVSTSQNRYDIGIWIREGLAGPGENQFDAISGDCRHWSLYPATAGQNDPHTAVGGPFLNSDGDSCGDLVQAEQTVLENLQLTNILCADQNGDGSADIGACVAYDNNANNPAAVCTDDQQAILNTYPNTGSKCRCQPLTLPITIGAKIIIEKQTVPDGDAQQFQFTTGGVAELTGQIGDDQTLMTLVAPGTYTTTETVPANWDLTSIQCTEDETQNTTVNLGSGSATIVAEAGEEIRCVFTNEKDAFIIVEKETDPDGSPQSFDFTTDYGSPFSLTDGQSNNSGDLDPGTYAVSETVPSGWELKSATCDDGSNPNAISLQAGETVTCTFNNEQDAFIIVEKVCVTTDPSPTQTFNFTSDFSGGPGTLACGGSKTSDALDPGTFAVSETVPSGWNLTSATCDDGSSPGSISLQAGETVTCTFTNTEGGKIIVEKQTLPDGDPQSFTFSGDASGSIGDGQTLMADVTPGQYTSTETVPAGWDLTSVVCDDGNSSGSTGTATATYNVEPGETVTCVFTNTKRGTIVVEKQTLPDGDPQSFGFAGDLAGSIGDGGMLSTEVVPGQYSTTETVPAGWDLTSIACDDGNSSGNTGTGVATYNVEPGETVTCVFTNTKRGNIRVAKETVPDGDATVFDFTGDVAASLSDGQASSFVEVVPGQYSSSETVPAEWDLTAISCDDGNSSGAGNTATFNVEPGESVTCTFTNSRKARLIVTKTITGGGAQLFDYSSTATGGFTLGHLGSNDSGFSLSPTTYTVCELLLAVSWNATATVNTNPVALTNPDFPADLGNRCVDVTLAYGDVTTIAWTNTAPGGDARTIGYWKNWSSCSKGNQFAKATERNQLDKTLDGNLPQTIGILDITTCEDGVSILDHRDIISGRKRANDAAYNLAAQLLAAQLNFSAGAGTCQAAVDAATDGQALLVSIGFDGSGNFLRPRDAEYADALMYAGILDDYNNNTLCTP